MSDIKDLHEEIANIIGEDAFDGVVLWPTHEFRITGASEADIETVKDEIDELTYRDARDEG